MPIFSNKFFNPVVLVAIENNVLGTLNKEAVDVADFEALQ